MHTSQSVDACVTVAECFSMYKTRRGLSLNHSEIRRQKLHVCLPLPVFNSDLALGQHPCWCQAIDNFFHDLKSEFKTLRIYKHSRLIEGHKVCISSRGPTFSRVECLLSGLLRQPISSTGKASFMNVQAIYIYSDTASFNIIWTPTSVEEGPNMEPPPKVRLSPYKGNEA